METNKIYHEPCLATLRRMPNEYLDCVITSPPYWQLRDYGWSEQWGLEKTFQEYLEHLWSMMSEIHRALKPSGTVWVNLGDTYGTKSGGLAGKNTFDPKNKNATHNVIEQTETIHKCLLLIPHRFAIGCIDRGWIIRNDIIWAKRNGMPESVRDRFSKKHEYFFFMVKSEDYFFDLDAVRDRSENNRWGGAKFTPATNGIYGDKNLNGLNRERDVSGDGRKNPGSVSDFWDIPTKPSSNEHYAAYNDELLKKPVLAGCPEYVCDLCGKPREKIIETKSSKKAKREDFKEQPSGNGQQSSSGWEEPEYKVVGLTDCGCNAGFSAGIIYDPFMGTGSTGEVALRANRRFVGSEGKEQYCKIANDRLRPFLTQTKLF